MFTKLLINFRTPKCMINNWNSFSFSKQQNYLFLFLKCFYLQFVIFMHFALFYWHQHKYIFHGCQISLHQSGMTSLLRFVLFSRIKTLYKREYSILLKIYIVLDLCVSEYKDKWWKNRERKQKVWYTYKKFFADKKMPCH